MVLGIVGKQGDKCPINVGDRLIFNPTKRHLYDLVGIDHGEIVQVEKVGEEGYTYTGLSPKICWKIDFKVLSTGVSYRGFSSQYFGREDEGVDF